MSILAIGLRKFDWNTLKHYLLSDDVDDDVVDDVVDDVERGAGWLDMVVGWSPPLTSGPEPTQLNYTNI